MKINVQWILLFVSMTTSFVFAQNSSINSSTSPSILDPGLFSNPLLNKSPAVEPHNHASSSLAGSSTASSLVESSSSSSVESSFSSAESSVAFQSVASSVKSEFLQPSQKQDESFVTPKLILEQQIPINTTTTLTWTPDDVSGAFTEQTPVLIIRGKSTGMTLCLTGAVHGDELNGIEMIRRIMHDINSEKLTGTIIGVPVANIMGFRRNSRYLPDRRDWNRYFPGNTYGSSASRLAHSFFTKVIMNCDALVDIHTGSFHRTNLPQLRADLADEKVAALAQNFGSIAVLNGRGNPNSLRAAAVRAGIPAVTLEAGEPMAMQSEVVKQGTDAIMMLISKLGMYGKQPRWKQSSPVYYKSSWVRANQSGILFSKVLLGNKVKKGDLLGTVTDPITNAQSYIKSPYDGRVIGMALDQVVMPGFATHHIGIQTLESILLEESAPMDDGMEDEDAGDEGIDDVDDDAVEANPRIPPPVTNE